MPHARKKKGSAHDSWDDSSQWSSTRRLALHFHAEVEREPIVYFTDVRIIARPVRGLGYVHGHFARAHDGRGGLGLCA